MNSCRVSAIVLAAGMSKRMGSLKQLAMFRGRPLLQIVVDSLRQSSVSEFVVVLGHKAERISGAVDLGEAKAVINEAYGEGMGSSIRVGISAIDARADGVVVVMVDQPLLRPSTIDCLIADFERKRGKLVIPVYRGMRGNPVLADKTLFQEMKRLTGDAGLRSVFAHYLPDTVEVPVDDAGILIDTDTAEDLERLGRIDFSKLSDDELFSIIDVKGRKIR